MAESAANNTSLNDSLVVSMRCDLCHHYLTPPVVQCFSLHIVCGKCAEHDVCKKCDKAFVKKEMHKIFQSISLLTFPCTFSDAECHYRGSWTDLLTHEAECSSRIYSCPTSLAKRCDWTGKASAIKSHFMDNHKFILLINNKQIFLCDLLLRANQVHLINAHKNFFILNIRFVKDEMLIALQYIGSKTEAQNYKYTVNFISHHTKLCLSQTENVIPDALSIDRENSVTVNIDMLKPMEEQNKAQLELVINCTEEPPMFSAEMLNKLKCPICLEYMRGLISMCEFGHSICNDCRLLVAVCPVCRGTITSSRNYALEEFCQIIKFPPS